MKFRITDTDRLVHQYPDPARNKERKQFSSLYKLLYKSHGLTRIISVKSFSIHSDRKEKTKFLIKGNITMKISSYDICSSSQRQYESKQEIQTQLRLSIPRRSIPGFPGAQINPLDNTSISAAAKNKYLSSSFFQMDKTVKILKAGRKTPPMNGEKQLVSTLVSHAAKGEVSFLQENILANVPRPRRQIPELFPPLGNSLTVSAMTTKIFQEKESTAVTTQGVIETQDGRQINFGMHLSMERTFISEETSAEKITMHQLTDPLVIQFEDGPPSFSDKVFSFDLTGDGKKETLHSLGKGSGFLAFDANGDGKINDGTELFGTKSGNGFADLAKYDEDGNGWIDENDSIFSKLSVWRPETKDQKGYSKGLLDSNVGAIFLGQTQSQHTISDEKGGIKGVVRSTGIFVKETGETGHVFQMDLARIKETEEKNPTRDKNLLLTDSQNQDSKKNPIAAIREAMMKVSLSLNSRYSFVEEKQQDSLSDMAKQLKEQMERLFAMFDPEKGKGISHRV